MWKKELVVTSSISMLIAVLLYSTLAFAQATAEEALKDSIDQQERMLKDASDKLKAAPPSSWTHSDIEEYLSAELYVVYLGTIKYVGDHKELPTALEDIVDDGCIAQWPENPLADWTPTEVLDGGGPFSPGVLIIQRPPSEYWSGRLNPRPCSFTISIFGPREGYPSAENLSTGPNRWALVPADAYLLANYYRESAASSQRKYDYFQKKREQASEDKDETGADPGEAKEGKDDA